MSRTRTITFSLRGFERPVEGVIASIGTQPTLIGRRGEPIKAGVKGIWKKNVIQYTIIFTNSERWDDVIQKVIEFAGGLDNLTNAIALHRPEFVQIDLALPVRTSAEQENGSVSASVLSKLCQLNAILSFSFV